MIVCLVDALYKALYLSVSAVNSTDCAGLIRRNIENVLIFFFNRYEQYSFGSITAVFAEPVIVLLRNNRIDILPRAVILFGYFAVYPVC